MIIKFQEWTPQLQKNAWIAEGSSVIGRVSMGEDSAVWFGCVVRGDVHHITIGDRSNIQDLSMIHVTHHKKADMSDGNPTVIGNDVTVGHRTFPRHRDPVSHQVAIRYAIVIHAAHQIGRVRG